MNFEKPRTYLYLLLTPIICAMAPEMAWTMPIRCAQVLDLNYQKLSHELLGLEADLLRTDLATNWKIDKSTAAAIRAMDHFDIRWRYSDRSKRVLIIEPDFQGRWLNRIAAGASKNLNGLELRFSPREFAKEKSMLFDPSSNYILIDGKTLLADQMPAALFHELRHAHHQHKFFENSQFLFSGFIELYSKKELISSIYTNSFSIEEVDTYLGEIHQLIKTQAYSSELKQKLKLLNRFVTWSRKVTLSFQSKLPLDLEISEQPELNFNAETQMMTTIDLRAKSFGLQLLFPESAKNRTTGQWTETTVMRLRTLSDRLEVIQIGLNQITAQIESGQFVKAEQNIKKLRKLMNQENEDL